MTGRIAHSLWLKQTAYTVIIVAFIAAVVASFEISRSYNNERQRFQEFGATLLDAFSDPAARAAFHVDRQQAESIVDGLMQYDVLDHSKILTNLGIVLAERKREFPPTSVKTIADWLFADITTFNRKLIINRAEFISGGQLEEFGSMIEVGFLELHANADEIGRALIIDVRSRIFDLGLEFLVLAAALAFVFHKTITRPLADIAAQLGSINLQDTEHAQLQTPLKHGQDELGLVVSRINELLNRIGEQQADLVHREKLAALGSMLAELAHELNNPLAVVTAQSELLAETAQDTATRERAQKILRPAIRSARIVRKFLTLTRRRKIEKAAINVPRLINESIELLSYQLKNNSISIFVDIATGVNQIWGDSSQLNQVLINLLINAEQALLASSEFREIQVKAALDEVDNAIIISIADNGPGIPDAIKPKVFNYFFTTKPEGRGTGLGLSLCKSVIEDHGGSIKIRDVDPHGTEVVIKLAATEQDEEEINGLAHLGQAIASLRVLVVDDEVELASSIAEVLVKYGHSAETANDASQALTKIKSEIFDVILADVHMPGIDGMRLYKQVLALDPDSARKFVFITGDALDRKLLRFFEKQQRPYLNKPFEIGELLKAVDRVLLASEVGPSAGTNTREFENV